MHFTEEAWQQVTQSTTVNCFCKCGYGPELQTVADLNANMEDDDAFLDDWIHTDSAEDIDFNAYISIDNELIKCSVSSIDKLCDDHEGDGGNEEEENEDKCEPKPAPSFAKAHTAFKTVKSFFYTHNIGEHNENTFNMERTLFGIKCKVSGTQLSIILSWENK
jgi:hypothetical protein